MHRRRDPESEYPLIAVIDTVHVLLATYNGSRHLAEQWASLEAQEGVRLVVHVADDGSTDSTPELVQRLADARGGAIAEVHWLHAPRRGSAARSFLQLLTFALSERPDAQWFAYCDQDDVWLPEKLSAALRAVAAADVRQPVLYGGRTLAVDEENRDGRLSPLFRRPPCFANAMVQNIMGGNTMLMNRAAALLVAPAVSLEVVTHDWFTYQIVSGAGGAVVYDPHAYVRYRQHASNEIGSNLGWRAMLRRFVRMLTGDYRDWNALQVAALWARRDVLTAENRAVLEAFAKARTARTPCGRLGWLRRSRVFRQPVAQHITLLAASLLRRI
jgi:glycosyltransferase involved in cell wall biosynthesis